MNTDSRYQLLFEPLDIGPVTTKNRFYQVPHCTGMGWLRPNMVADLRATKAEGGWGVVCTEYCSIHPTSDDIPLPTHTLWDDDDIRAHRIMTDKVHEHGALAGVELWVGGSTSVNFMSREVPMDVVSLPSWNADPYQARAMSKADIRNLRRWHRDAALRARQAGFDIVYVYATHHYLLANFLNPSLNKRTDEYGGNQENRMRLVREIIEDTRDAVGDTCAVAVRYAIDDGGGPDGAPVLADRMEIFEALAELPDLWDINVDDYALEMGTSRFVQEGALEAYVGAVKSMTSKPVVSVGRFTSPDAMVSQLKRGIVDLIGAARPSIADPFLPRKIEEGRPEDIRECIGCNICFTGDSRHYPIRCTQNPTTGEEWSRGWHPEKIAPRASDGKVLVVGAGPAGLEAARALGQRGYHVMLAEATRVVGGRVTAESALPGLAEWARVRDYRAGQINKMPNVDIYCDNQLDLAQVLEIGADHVAIATGSTWRRDGFGITHPVAMNPLPPAEKTFTPDDIMNGRMPGGSVLVFDDDRFYMGGVIAERLAANGNQVTYLTPAPMASFWTSYTDEHDLVYRRLARAGVRIILNRELRSYDGEQATTACVYTGAVESIGADNVVLVTGRASRDALYHELQAAMEQRTEGAPRTVACIGDANAPAIIAAAVYAGHKYARELDCDRQPGERVKWERVRLG